MQIVGLHPPSDLFQIPCFVVAARSSLDPVFPRRNCLPVPGRRLPGPVVLPLPDLTGYIERLSSLPLRERMLRVPSSAQGAGAAGAHAAGDATGGRP
jgi:hypothetical protein